MIVGLDPGKTILVLEMPLVLLNPTDNAPVVRTALELNGQLAWGMRIALRPPSLLLRSVTPLSTLPPMRLLALLSSFADLSRGLEIFFTTRFSYRTANPYTNAMGGGGGRIVAPRIPPFKLALDAAGAS
ncbi:MAG TPA: hypothetical protein VE981_24135 [Planctomycetota bacterium]|nr:hypothetical protein [Planctomycetota bacterium]